MQFRHMIESIESVTDMSTLRIIICDNNSTQPEMIDLLNGLSTKYEVIRNKENLLFEGFNPGLSRVDTEYFMISDPDILLNTEMPRSWAISMVEAMKCYKAPKIGLALSIDFDISNPYLDQVRKAEQRCWEKEVRISNLDVPCFVAGVDTTLAVYRRDTYAYWSCDKMVFDGDHGIAPEGHIKQEDYNKKYPEPVIRIAGYYTARHTGWTAKEHYPTDFEWYTKNGNYMVSSSLYFNKFRG
jgi:hypothetical protein